MTTESDRSMDVADDNDHGLRPTHRLKDISTGDNSVQLLVSTKDHLYNAEAVSTGTSSCQVIGAWQDSTIEELSNCISVWQNTAARRNNADKAAFGTRYGSGKSLDGTVHG